MPEDSTSTLLRSIKHFFSGTLISRVTGLLRDMSMAFAFGTQGSVAAFLMAFRFAHLLRRLLGEGAMQSAFIPQFEKLKSLSPERACRFFIDLSMTLSLCLLGVIALGMAGCGICVGLNLVSEGNREVLTYTLIMLPSLLFICLFGLNAALLQCDRHYFTPSIAPVIFNLVWIGAALLLAHVPIAVAMPWLSGSIILACAAQWALTVPKTMRILRKYDPQILLTKTSLLSSDIKQLAAPLFMAIIGVSASQINNALDVVFARYAEAEGPAYLWYAIRLQQLPLALFGIAISGALLPPLTRAIKNNDAHKFRHFLGFALRRSLTLMLPMTAGIFLLGSASVRLLFGHGDFHEESVVATTACLWGYAAGLVPMTLVLILAPAFYAQENFRTPTKASLLAMALNVALNAAFVMAMGWGSASVAWATSFSAFANMILLGIALKGDIKEILTVNFFQSLGKISACTAVAMAGAFLLMPFLPEPPLATFSYLMAQTGAFAAIFFASAYVFKAEDAFFWRGQEAMK